MKIYKYLYKNYYLGPRTFHILANNVDEARDLMYKTYKRFLEDDDTQFVKLEKIDLSEPKILM